MIPTCMPRAQLRRLDLFTERDHPNTLAPLEPGGLWVVLHNRGKVRAAGRGRQVVIAGRALQQWCGARNSTRCALHGAQLPLSQQHAQLTNM